MEQCVIDVNPMDDLAVKDRSVSSFAMLASFVRRVAVAERAAVTSMRPEDEYALRSALRDLASEAGMLAVSEPLIVTPLKRRQSVYAAQDSPMMRGRIKPPPDDKRNRR